jgi:hypothetical protein
MVPPGAVPFQATVRLEGVAVTAKGASGLAERLAVGPLGS